MRAARAPRHFIPISRTLARLRLRPRACRLRLARAVSDCPPSGRARKLDSSGRGLNGQVFWVRGNHAFAPVGSRVRCRCRAAGRVRLGPVHPGRPAAFLRCVADGAADHQLADQRRQPLQPALFAAHGHQPHQRRAAQGRVARAAARLRQRSRSTRASPRRSWTTASPTSAPAPTTCSRCRSTAARSCGSGRRTSIPSITSVCCGWNNKGVALSDDKVFQGLLDGRLVALDRATGKLAWSIQAERWQENFSITAAPLYVDGMVIIGFAGGDRGTRSRLKAYDAKDGRLIWTFYTIPGPGEPGHDTWPKDNDAWKYGGAAIWQTPAVDPELGLLYFSTGNAAPDYNGAFRAGDNLYAASMLAIELDDRQVPLALPAGAPRHLGLRRRQSRRPDGRAHGRPHAQGDRRSGQDRLGLHPRSRNREAAHRHRREAGAAGAAAGDREDAAVPARRRRSCRSSSRSRPRGTRSSTTAASSRRSSATTPTIVAPGIWGGASWPPSSLRPRAAAAVRLRVVGDQRLHRRRRREVRAAR